MLLIVGAPVVAGAQSGTQASAPLSTSAVVAQGTVETLPQAATSTPAPTSTSASASTSTSTSTSASASAIRFLHLSEGAAAASAAASAAAAAVTAGVLPEATAPYAIPPANAPTDGGTEAATDKASNVVTASTTASTTASIPESATESSTASDAAEESGDDGDDRPTLGLMKRSKPLPIMPTGMNESVIRIPLTGAQIDLSLEATLFKPDGPGPFPIIIFNHGKERGDPKQQKRSRPLALAREFVQRGYAVLAPNREGFADSDGSYSEQLCGIEDLGLQQAADVAAAVHYIKQQPYAQANRIVIIGASEGGLASIAYGEQPAAGVVGIVNFSGGLRQDACDTWQQAMVDAFHAYGERSQIPTLWFYGDNDRFWPSTLAPQLFAAYRSGGGRAMLIDFGAYKDNAHRLVGDRDSVPVWWPGIARFLHRLGMPTKVRFAVTPTMWPPASGFAPLNAVNAVPYLDAEGRAGYQNFLEKYPTRAFALSDSGAWSWAEGGDDPVSVALDSCQRNSRDACHLYAIDNTVVWPTR